MVTPELGREYARRGIRLIDPEEGTRGAAARTGLGRGVGRRRRLHRVGLVTDMTERHTPGGPARRVHSGRHRRDGRSCCRAPPTSTPTGGTCSPAWTPSPTYRTGAGTRTSTTAGLRRRPAVADRVYCRRGGFVDELAEVELTRFGIMPNSVPAPSPTSSSRSTWPPPPSPTRAATTGCPDRHRIGVVLGRGGYLTPGLVRLDQRVRTAGQLVRTLRRAAARPGRGPARPRPDGVHRPARARQPESAIGLVPNLAASRVANRLDLRGPAYTVDAACASSLVAVDQAVSELASGPLRPDARRRSAPLPRHHPVERLLPAPRALPEPADPPLPPGRRRHPDRRGHRRGRPQAPGRRRARRRPDLRRHPGHRRGQRRPRRRPRQPRPRRPGPRRTPGLARPPGSTRAARTRRPPGGARHRDPGRRRGRTDHPGRGVRPARHAGGEPAR